MRKQVFLVIAALMTAACGGDGPSGPSAGPPMIEMQIGDVRVVPGIAGQEASPSYWSGYTPVFYAIVSEMDDTRIVATGAGEDSLVDATGRVLARVRVAAPPPTGRPTFVAVDVGYRHACALTGDGAVFCWGADGQPNLFDLRGAFGGLALPRCFYETAYRAAAVGCSPVPVRIAGAPPLVSLDAGTYRTCGLTSDGTPYCWGGSFQASGPGVGGPYRALATDTPSGTCGVTIAGALQCSRNGVAVTHVRPDVTFDTVASTSSYFGPTRACALDRDGRAYCWGYGIPGDGSDPGSTATTEPVLVAGDVRFTTIAVSFSSTCAISTEGRAYCWGRPVPDATGVLPPSSARVPTVVPTDLRFRAIAMGAAPPCALTNEGAVHCFDGTMPGGQFVVARVGATRLRSLSLATRSGLEPVSCGIRMEGDAVCWGDAAYGLTGTAYLTGFTAEPERVAGIPAPAP